MKRIMSIIVSGVVLAVFPGCSTPGNRMSDILPHTFIAEGMVMESPLGNLKADSITAVRDEKKINQPEQPSVK